METNKNRGNNVPAKGITRRDLLKNAVWVPFIGGMALSGCDNSGKSAISSVIADGDLDTTSPDSWFRFCQPILEWVNPHPDLDPVKYVEGVVVNAKKAGANTVYFVIDYGGAPIYNGASEEKAKIVGDADLLALLEKRLHEENMYFVSAQFGGHTISAMVDKNPEWVQRNFKGEFLYGPGGLPLMCFNSGYREYVARELKHIVTKYKTDGIYIEGLNYKNCYCHTCSKKYREIYHSEIPEIIQPGDMPAERFYLDASIDFVGAVREAVKEVSPETVIMACVSSFKESSRVDWQGLGKVADVVSQERMWGYGIPFPLYEIGMHVNIMKAESGRDAFTTAWYAKHVDREYTAREIPLIMLNYFEPIINQGTCQFHTQNVLEENPDHIDVLNEIYSYTKKIRPYYYYTERTKEVSILYDRDKLYADSNFTGYYKALVFRHIPVRVISRDYLTREKLNGTKVLILPNVLRLSEDETRVIREFTSEGGLLVCTYRTGFGTSTSLESSIADLLGIKRFISEEIKDNPVVSRGRSQWEPEYYRAERIHYFRNTDEGFARKYNNRSLLSYPGGLMVTELMPQTRVISNTLKIDKERQGPQHPVYGFYPAGPDHPLILENDYGKGRVIYFAGDLDKVFLVNGYPYVADILAGAVCTADLDLSAEAPVSVEITWYKRTKDNSLLVNMLNSASYERQPTEPIGEIIPVRNIRLKARGFSKAASLQGTALEYSVTGGILNVSIPELNVIDTIVLYS